MIAARLALATAIGLAASAVPAAAQELYGTLKKVRDTKTFTIGHREATIPLSYYDEQKKPVGFAIDLCQRIAEEVKKELKLPSIEIKYLPVNAQTRIPLITNGTVDIECGQTTNTLARQQQVDFTYNFYITGQRLLTVKGSGIKRLEDLDNKAAGVQAGSLGERTMKELVEKSKAKVRFVYVRDLAEGVLALETGRIDGFVNDEVALFGVLTKVAQKDRMEIVGPYLTFDPYGLMLRRDDSAFRLVANRTLALIYRSDEIQALFKKHFGPFGITMTPEVESNFKLHAIPD